MNVEEILSKAINCLMDRRLSNAIEVLEQLYVQRPSLMGHSEFEAIKTDYQLMVDLSLIHISEPTRLHKVSRMPSSA